MSVLRPLYLNDLDPRGLVEAEMFSLLQRHFKQYDLLNRFNTKAIQEISELKNLYAVEEFDNEEEYAILLINN